MNRPLISRFLAHTKITNNAAVNISGRAASNNAEFPPSSLSLEVVKHVTVHVR
jgi:hypothetical protein